jgi:acetylornithine/succinyldiaminopimelate/putrescine aminotransferase
MRRSEPVVVSCRKGEFEDLNVIADGWGVPVATVVWAMMHDALARYRLMAPTLGPNGLVIAAALEVLRVGHRERVLERAAVRAAAEVEG